MLNYVADFPSGSVVKSPPPKYENTGLIPGVGRSPEERNGKPLQYSFLENPMDRAARQAAFHGVTVESDMTWRLNSNNNYVAFKELYGGFPGGSW